MLKSIFRRRATASVTEERVIGILSASLPYAKLAIREYGKQTLELYIDDTVFTIYPPNAFTDGQWIISEGYLMVARSASLFRAVMLIAHNLK
jgi:hypothetical protein